MYCVQSIYEDKKLTEGRYENGNSKYFTIFQTFLSQRLGKMVKNNVKWSFFSCKFTKNSRHGKSFQIAPG